MNQSKRNILTSIAILAAEEDGSLSIEFRRVGYDRGATVRAMYENGMPHAAWWSEGWQ